MVVEHVEGKNSGTVMLYALSTCVWCKMTRKLLTDLGIEFSYTYVDLLEGEERENTVNDVKRWNPSCSFPTVVINDSVVVGYREEKIREALGQ